MRNVEDTPLRYFDAEEAALNGSYEPEGAVIARNPAVEWAKLLLYLLLLLACDIIVAALVQMYVAPAIRTYVGIDEEGER